MKQILYLLSNRKLVDWVVTISGILGLAIFLYFYPQVIPSAGLQLTYSRAQIAELANAYMVQHGYEVSDYEFALSFGTDSQGMFFLQRQLGIDEMNRLVKEENIPLWYWRARWFKPMQEEEFLLYLLPDGKVDNFTHIIPEAQAGASLEIEAAEEIAKRYLSEDLDWDLANWQRVAASSQEQLGGRIDHEFEWKRRDFDVDDSELRLRVSVQGNEIGVYDYRFKTPEVYWRKISEQRLLPNIITAASLTFGLVLAGFIAVICCLVAYLQGVRLFHRSLPLALLVGVVSLLAGLNAMPMESSFYATTQNYLMFWFGHLGLYILSAVLLTLLILILLEGGLYIARQVWPYRDVLLPRSHDRWQELARSSWRGFMLGGVLLGYVVLFYLAATQVFGAWAPSGTDYSDIYATPFPFLASLQMGLEPAALEEILSRLVGISLILLLTRKKWLALLIPGVFWAFAHLSYIRDPFYLRGIELLVTAVLIHGVFFLAYDLTTVIVAHLTYNAALGLFPMLLSGEPSFTASGVIGFVLLLSPVLIGLVMSRVSKIRGRRAGSLLMNDASMQSSCIRPAGLEDAAGLQSLLPEWGDWHKTLEDPLGVVACLEAGEALVGAAVGKLQEGETGRLAFVYVHPAWRGKFWGSRLTQALSQHMRERGAVAVEAEIDAKDKTAGGFLGSLNWYTIRRVLTPRDQSYLLYLWNNYWKQPWEIDRRFNAWVRNKLRWVKSPAKD